MEFIRKNKAVLALLLCILILALLLRVFNIGHVLSWDEAWNLHTVRDGARGLTQTEYFSNFYRHPPGYIGLGIVYAYVTGTGRAGLATAMELLSIISSLLLIVLIFLCGRDWFDERAGLVAAFIFALLPISRVFDTWVKQESMTLLFGLAFLLLFFRKRYIWAGVALGIAVLTKEIAVFVPLAVLLFILVTRRFKEIRNLAISSLVAVAASFWWYLFFSTSKGAFTEFFFGKSLEAQEWHHPWHYYLGRLPADLGWPVLILSLIALAVLVYEWRTKKTAAGDGKAYRPQEMVLFVICWIIAVYVPMSVSYGKPPWMVYSAAPAFALLAGWGAVELVNVVEKRKRLALSLVGLLLVLCLTLSLPVGFGTYVVKADPSFNNAKRDKRVADYINKSLGAGGRVVMRSDDQTPRLLYYLDLYDPRTTAFIPHDAPTGADPAGQKLYLLDHQVTLDEASQRVRAISPDLVLMLRWPPGVANAPVDLTAPFSQLVHAVILRDEWIFDGKKLAQAIAHQPGSK